MALSVLSHLETANRSLLTFTESRKPNADSANPRTSDYGWALEKDLGTRRFCPAHGPMDFILGSTSLERTYLLEKTHRNMKHFPFKILLLCIFLPPMCYILTIQLLEGYLQRREYSHLNKILIQNHDALYEGLYTVKEEISRNIWAYLGKSLRYKAGISTNIMVKTKDDQILYPAQIRNTLDDTFAGEDLTRISGKTLNYMDVAADNYRTLNKGLVLSVGVQIRRDSWLSMAILLFYLSISLLILQRFVRKGFGEMARQEAEQKKVIERLSDKLILAETKLEEVEAKEGNYNRRIQALNKEKKDLSTDIDGLLDEMEKLEDGLARHRRLREETEIEVLHLREEIARLTGMLEKPKHKRKRVETTSKRFKVLYKRLHFTDRAIEGFLSLPDEFQLKAEEIIHKLNENDSQISVRRKVFGKGGKMNVLETEFSYSGRIYFQKDSQPKTTIVAVGTKNTQEQDLSYIEASQKTIAS